MAKFDEIIFSNELGSGVMTHFPISSTILAW